MERNQAGNTLIIGDFNCAIFRCGRNEEETFYTNLFVDRTDFPGINHLYKNIRNVYYEL